MDHFNLLDFDNDVLNIIGDYVKQDNHDKMRKERVKQILKKELFNYIDYVLLSPDDHYGRIIPIFHFLW